jgi:2-aminoethylphosphonate-pyruvate transaminase
MDLSCYPDTPYLLLPPGPLSTSKSVKAVMLRD